MNLNGVRQMAALLLRFRNGPELVRCLRAGRPCDELVLWDGTRLAHPPNRAGLLEAVQEIWLQRDYTGGFYRPADGDVIVDAGANIGLFSILMARQNRRCRVVALEPFAENFNFLQANVAAAAVENVTCCETALGASVGKGRMQALGGRSLDHVLQAEAPRSNGGETNPAGDIPVVPLSGLFDLAHAPQIDFLKVDIEGSERDVFAAATPEALGRIQRVAMEYHDNLVPGTLELLCRVFGPTHDVAVHPSSMAGCGMLHARRRDVES